VSAGASSAARAARALGIQAALARRQALAQRLRLGGAGAELGWRNGCGLAAAAGRAAQVTRAAWSAQTRARGRRVQARAGPSRASRVSVRGGGAEQRAGAGGPERVETWQPG
jgi:hypothetical protein